MLAPAGEETSVDVQPVRSVRAKARPARAAESRKVVVVEVIVAVVS